MAHTKAKAVFTAEPELLRQIKHYVSRGRYRSSSEFLREAIREKLANLERQRLMEQVTKYCGETDISVDTRLIENQAFAGAVI